MMIFTNQGRRNGEQGRRGNKCHTDVEEKTVKRLKICVKVIFYFKIGAILPPLKNLKGQTEMSRFVAITPSQKIFRRPCY